MRVFYSGFSIAIKFLLKRSCISPLISTFPAFLIAWWCHCYIYGGMPAMLTNPPRSMSYEFCCSNIKTRFFWKSTTCLFIQHVFYYAPEIIPSRIRYSLVPIRRHVQISSHAPSQLKIHNTIKRHSAIIGAKFFLSKVPLEVLQNWVLIQLIVMPHIL